MFLFEIFHEGKQVKVMAQISSYDNLNIKPDLGPDLLEQIFHMTLLLIKENNGATLFGNPSINVEGKAETSSTYDSRGWSSGAMVLGKLPVPGHPTNMDHSRARANCACSGCRWGLFGHFFSRLSFLFSFSLSLGDGPI